jgi:hypothetical protein
MNAVKVLVGAVALACCSAASAEPTITVTWKSPVFNPASVDVGTVYHPGGSTGTNAGRFNGKVTATTEVSLSELVQDADNFFAYCHDLAQFLSSGKYSVGGASGVMLDFLGAVNSVLGGDEHAWITAGDINVAAAIQLGIWEARYDGVFDLATGPVYLKNLAIVPDAVKTQYAEFIAAMGTSDSLDGQYVMVLTNPDTQDVITGRRPPSRLLPEPGSLALLAAAGAIATACSRRRR